MHEVDRKADVAKGDEFLPHRNVKAGCVETEYDKQGGESPDKGSSKLQDVGGLFRHHESRKEYGGKGKRGVRNRGRHLSFDGQGVDPAREAVSCHTPDEVEHNCISVEIQRSKMDAGQLIEDNEADDKSGGNQSAIFPAAFQRSKENQIEEYLAVYRPADAHQGLQDAATDVERDEEQTF